MNWLQDVTFGITWYLRERDLSDCVDSIREHCGESAKIITQDTAGNVSRGRNQLLDRVDTRFYFMLEEDMRLTPRTNLNLMWRIMQEGVSGVSGILQERRRRRAVAIRYRRQSGKLFILNSEKLRLTDRQEPWILADGCSQWGLFETGILRSVKWDERLELQEHWDFFDRFSRQGHSVGVCRSEISHLRSRPTEAYIAARRRGRNVYFRKEREIIGDFKIVQQLNTRDLLEGKGKLRSVESRETRMAEKRGIRVERIRDSARKRRRRKTD